MSDGIMDGVPRAMKAEARIAELEAEVNSLKRRLAEGHDLMKDTLAEVGRLQQLAEIRLQESMRQEMAKEEAEAQLARLMKWIDEDENQWIQRGDLRYVLEKP
jgi:hypothetical protein